MTELHDLGIPNARRPAADIVSGGQPSPAQIAAAGEAGYRTVLTTRAPMELMGYDERADVEAAGMAYVELPITCGADLSPARVKEFAAAIAHAEKPLLIHCGSGNRIGALFALMAAWLDGKSPEEALAVGRQCGLTGLEPTVRYLLS